MSGKLGPSSAAWKVFCQHQLKPILVLYSNVRHHPGTCSCQVAVRHPLHKEEGGGNGLCGLAGRPPPHAGWPLGPPHIHAVLPKDVDSLATPSINPSSGPLLCSCHTYPDIGLSSKSGRKRASFKLWMLLSWPGSWSGTEGACVPQIHMLKP